MRAPGNRQGLLFCPELPTARGIFMCPAGGAIKGAFAARFAGGVGPNAPRPGPPPLLKKRPHTTSKNGPCLEHPLKSSSHLVTLVLLQWGNGKRSLYPRVQRSVYFWDTYKVRRCIIYIGGKKKKKKEQIENTHTHTHTSFSDLGPLARPSTSRSLPGGRHRKPPALLGQISKNETKLALTKITLDNSPSP